MTVHSLAQVRRMVELATEGAMESPSALACRQQNDARCQFRSLVGRRAIQLSSNGSGRRLGILHEAPVSCSKQPLELGWGQVKQGAVVKHSGKAAPHRTVQPRHRPRRAVL